jgi:hypothetical protein
VEVLRVRVEAANALFLVTETCAHGLRDVQHVGDIVPAVWVVLSRQVIIDHARSVLFEKTDQRVGSWAYVGDMKSVRIS